jgi:hypothetical protein
MVFYQLYTTKDGTYNKKRTAVLQAVLSDLSGGDGSSAASRNFF